MSMIIINNIQQKTAPFQSIDIGGGFEWRGKFYLKTAMSSDMGVNACALENKPPSSYLACKFAAEDQVVPRKITITVE